MLLRDDNFQRRRRTSFQESPPPSTSGHLLWPSPFICNAASTTSTCARDLHAPDSIALLRRQGIDFACNAVAGVSSARFAELAAASGLLFNDAVTWVTFHGAYDLGYLVKALTGRFLPASSEEFLGVVKGLFEGKVYDVKYMMQFCNGLYGGLDRLAQTLKVDRVAGKCHQAGSDSLLTWQAFRKIRETYFVEYEFEKYANVLFGL